MTPPAPLRALALAVAVALLAGCYGESPPPGFEAIPTRSPSRPGDDCPDLTGTFDLAEHPLARTILGRTAPDGQGHPVRLHVDHAGSQPVAWWQIPRADLLAFARALAERDPDAYFRWRSLALREQLPPELALDERRWRAALAELGPPLSIVAGLSGRQCEAGWMLVAVRDLGPAPSDDETPSGRSLEEEIWLARNPAGDLLIRSTVFELIHYSIYATASQSIRVPPGETRWARVPALAPEPEARITAEDLPPAYDPATHASRCPVDPGRIVDFTQRMTAVLPARVERVRTDVAREEAVDPATGCRRFVLTLGYEAARTADLDGVDAVLRAQGDVQAVAAEPDEAARRGLRRMWHVTLK